MQTAQKDLFKLDLNLLLINSIILRELSGLLWGLKFHPQIPQKYVYYLIRDYGGKRD